MSLLAGIVGSFGGPLKIGTTFGTTSSTSSDHTAITLSGATDGQIQVVMHYVNYNIQNTPIEPDTPTNFTSLASGIRVGGFSGSSNISYRISYRIYSSTVSTFSLPALASNLGVDNQVAIGLKVAPAAGYSFSGLSVESQSINTYAGSASIGTVSLSASKNDICLGVLYGYYNGTSLATLSGSTMDSYLGQLNTYQQLYAGFDLRQNAGTTTLGGSLPSGPSMYALQVLRPTFS